MSVRLSLPEQDPFIGIFPSRDQHIGIVDGLSLIPRKLTSIGKAEDKDRMAMAAINIERQTWPLRIAGQAEDREALIPRVPGVP